VLRTFQTMNRNEKKLNRIFINIYGLQDELTPEVENKDVTVYPVDFDHIEKNVIIRQGCRIRRVLFFSNFSPLFQ